MSRDQGATWQHFTNGSWAPPHQFEGAGMTNIAVSERFAYVNDMSNSSLARAPLNALVGAEHWNVEYCETPESDTAGGAPFGMASSYNADAKRGVILAGSLDETIWKHVEPPP